MSRHRWPTLLPASRCSCRLAHTRPSAVADKWRWLLLVFGCHHIDDEFVTYLAAKRVKSVADFYTAGGGVSGLRTAGQLQVTTCLRRRSSASRFDFAVRLRRLHVFSRLAGRVITVAAGHCRAVPQHRQVPLSDILATGTTRKREDSRRDLGDHGVTFYLTRKWWAAGCWSRR